MKGNRIALFGGTFDPIHNGHLALAELARDACQLDQVIFIPCAQSPFKTEHSTVADAEQRFEMVSNAISTDDRNNWAIASRFEIDRPPPSYSWQTARHFSETAGGETSQLFWILGTDQWNAIDRWAEPEILRKLLTFIVVTRSGNPIQKREGWNHIPLEFHHPASSTAIREGTGEPDWIPEPNQELTKTIYTN